MFRLSPIGFVGKLAYRNMALRLRFYFNAFNKTDLERAGLGTLACHVGMHAHSMALFKASRTLCGIVPILFR